MSNKNTGGPAFPAYQSGHSGKAANTRFVPDGGLTMRDYFAAKALNALLVDAPRGTSFGVDHMDTNMNYAMAAYAIADAMLEARND